MSNLLSKEDYQVLQRADIATDGDINSFLNRTGFSNWTVCPECRVDDFSHVEGCSLAELK